jgi:hypothetical protein
MSPQKWAVPTCAKNVDEATSPEVSKPDRPGMTKNKLANLTWPDKKVIHNVEHEVAQPCF